MKLKTVFIKNFLPPVLLGLITSFTVTVILIYTFLNNIKYNKKILDIVEQHNYSSSTPSVQLVNNLITRELQTNIYSVFLIKQYFEDYLNNEIFDFSNSDTNLNHMKYFIKKYCFNAYNLALNYPNISNNINSQLKSIPLSNYLYSTWFIDNNKRDINSLSIKELKILYFLVNLNPIFKTFYDSTRYNEEKSPVKITIFIEGIDLTYIYPLFYSKEIYAENYINDYNKLIYNPLLDNNNFYKIFVYTSNYKSCLKKSAGYSPDYFYPPCTYWYNDNIKIRRDINLDLSITTPYLINNINNKSDIGISITKYFELDIDSYIKNIERNKLYLDKIFISFDIKVNSLFKSFDEINFNEDGYFYITRVLSKFPFYYINIKDSNFIPKTDLYEYYFNSEYHITEQLHYYNNIYIPELIRYNPEYNKNIDYKNNILNGEYSINNSTVNYSLFPLSMFINDSKEMFAEYYHIYNIVLVHKGSNYSDQISSILEYVPLLIIIHLAFIIFLYIVFLFMYNRHLCCLAKNIVNPIKNLTSLIQGFNKHNNNDDLCSISSNISSTNQSDKSNVISNLKKVVKSSDNFINNTNQKYNEENKFLIENNSKYLVSKDNNIYDKQDIHDNNIYNKKLKIYDTIKDNNNYNNNNSPSNFTLITKKESFNNINNQSYNLIEGCYSANKNLVKKTEKIIDKNDYIQNIGVIDSNIIDNFNSNKSINIYNNYILDSEDINNEDNKELYLTRSIQLDYLYSLLFKLKYAINFTMNTQSNSIINYIDYLFCKSTFNLVKNSKGVDICDSNIGNLSIRLKNYDKAILHLRASIANITDKTIIFQKLDVLKNVKVKYLKEYWKFILTCSNKQFNNRSSIYKNNKKNLHKKSIYCVNSVNLACSLKLDYIQNEFKSIFTEDERLDGLNSFIINDIIKANYLEQRLPKLVKAYKFYYESVYVTSLLKEIDYQENYYVNILSAKNQNNSKTNYLSTNNKTYVNFNTNNSYYGICNDNIDKSNGNIFPKEYYKYKLISLKLSNYNTNFNNIYLNNETTFINNYRLCNYYNDSYFSVNYDSPIYLINEHLNSYRSEYFENNYIGYRDLINNVKAEVSSKNYLEFLHIDNNNKSISSSTHYLSEYEKTLKQYIFYSIISNKPMKLIEALLEYNEYLINFRLSHNYFKNLQTIKNNNIITEINQKLETTKKEINNSKSLDKSTKNIENIKIKIDENSSEILKKKKVVKISSNINNKKIKNTSRVLNDNNNNNSYNNTNNQINDEKILTAKLTYLIDLIYSNFKEIESIILLKKNDFTNENYIRKLNNTLSKVSDKSSLDIIETPLYVFNYKFNIVKGKFYEKIGMFKMSLFFYLEAMKFNTVTHVSDVICANNCIQNLIYNVVLKYLNEDELYIKSCNINNINHLNLKLLLGLESKKYKLNYDNSLLFENNYSNILENNNSIIKHNVNTKIKANEEKDVLDLKNKASSNLIDIKQSEALTTNKFTISSKASKSNYNNNNLSPIFNKSLKTITKENITSNSTNNNKINSNNYMNVNDLYKNKILDKEVLLDSLNNKYIKVYDYLKNLNLIKQLFTCFKKDVLICIDAIISLDNNKTETFPNIVKDFIDSTITKNDRLALAYFDSSLKLIFNLNNFNECNKEYINKEIDMIPIYLSSNNFTIVDEYNLTKTIIDSYYYLISKNSLNNKVYLKGYNNDLDAKHSSNYIQYNNDVKDLWVICFVCKIENSLIESVKNKCLETISNSFSNVKDISKNTLNLAVVSLEKISNKDEDIKNFNEITKIFNENNKFYFKNCIFIEIEKINNLKKRMKSLGFINYNLYNSNETYSTKHT